MKKLTGVLFLLVAAFLPLIACFHIEIVDFLQYPWFPNQGYWFDFFLYGKSSFLQTTAVLLAVLLVICKIRSKEKHKTIENGLLFLTGLLLILSAVCSDYPQSAIKGSIEQYEPAGVLLAYLMLLYAGSELAKEEHFVKWIVRALMFGLAVSCVIGIFQLIQCDFWSSGFGKRLLVPNAYQELRESLRFSKDAEEFARVYMALYNPSYAGIYIVMLLPFLVLSEKKYAKILLVFAVLCLAGTMAKTAWIAAGVVWVLGLWLCRKISKKQAIGLGLVLTAGLALLGNIENDGIIPGDKKLQAVVCEEEAIRIVYQGNTIYLSEYPKDEGVRYRILDENGQKLEFTWSEERGELDPIDPKYEGLHFKVYLKDDISYAVFRYEDVVFRFTDDLGTGKYEYITLNGKPDELVSANVLFESGDRILNGRGYIWNRTMPIILENLFLGTGPDTFMQVFPQNDYVARANLGYGFFSEILTNAHNLYLQSIMQTGIVAFICMLVFAGVYVKKAWKYYVHKNEYDRIDKIGLACVLGSIGYLICGFTFASSVCTTPIFMILVGTGIGIINRNSGEKYETDEDDT